VNVGTVATTLILAVACGSDSGTSVDGGESTEDRADARQLPPAGCDRSELETLAESLAPGEVQELATNGLTGELHFDGNANTVYGYGFESFWDANTCQVLFIGGGHLSLTKFIAYNASRNEWFQAADPNFLCPIRTESDEVAWGCVNHAYGNDAYDPETGTFYYFYDGGIHALEVNDTLSNEWQRVADWPASTSYTSMEFLTNADRLVVVEADQLHLVDPTNGSSSTIEGPFPMGDYHYYGVYNPMREDFLFGSGNSSSEMNLMGSDMMPVPVAAAPKGFHPEPGDGDNLKILTFDPATGRYLAYAQAGELYEYNPDANEWTTVEVDMPAGANVAAAITSYGVILFVDVDRNRIYVYKHG